LFVGKLRQRRAGPPEAGRPRDGICVELLCSDNVFTKISDFDIPDTGNLLII